MEGKYPLTVPKIVVHTDILLDYLTHTGKNESVLRRATWKFFCYTTVFNAIELFSLAKNDNERKAVEQSMNAMKILGLNAKNAKKYGDLFASGLRLQRMNMLIAGVCLESKLPLLTGQPKEFRGVKGLVIIPASAVDVNKSGTDILRANTRRLKSN